MNEPDDVPPPAAAPEPAEPAVPDRAAQVRHVIQAALQDFTGGQHRGVVVDSPPGAGKSRLVVQAASQLASAGEPVMVIAQTNDQVDDLIERMALSDDQLRIGRLVSERYIASERVLRYGNVQLAKQVPGLNDPQVTIATAAKWAEVSDTRWAWAIADEAYQMRSDALLRIANCFDRALFVGDPGQLDPFSTVDIDRWTGLTWDPMQSAVAVLLRTNPDLPVHQLPVSWRLTAQAAPPVSRAFYPFTGFVAATDTHQRQLVLQTRGMGTAADRVLDTAAARGWALHELPAAHTVRTDPEAIDALVTLALRLGQRGAVAVSEVDPAGHPVTAERIAIGASHRDQVAAIRQQLDAVGAHGIRADTANSLQGSEYDVVLVLHPLSGRRDATAFHLESGRLCVLTSRHRHACIVVARAGIADLLDAHPPTEPMYIDTPAKFPDGWEANHAMLEHLSAHRVAAA